MARYAGIASELGLSRAGDAAAARELDRVLRDPAPLGAAAGALAGRAVFVAGAGPSLAAAVPRVGRHAGMGRGAALVAADSALGTVVAGGTVPDVVVTDLDGDWASLARAAAAGSLMVVHAHGDNAGRLHLAARFGRCLGTAQGRPPGRLHNFGGFTDGDRAAFMAESLGASAVVLCGMDLRGGRIGSRSRTAPRDRAAKLRKLEIAADLLEWLAEGARCPLYSMSGSLRGFARASPGDLGKIASGRAP